MCDIFEIRSIVNDSNYNVLTNSVAVVFGKLYIIGIPRNKNIRV